MSDKSESSERVITKNNKGKTDKESKNREDRG